MDEYGYINKTISKSRFDRRLHAMNPHLWRALLDLLEEAFKQSHPDQTYMMDSLPIPVCDNIRIKRSRIYPRARSMGRLFAATWRANDAYFYGLRLYLLITGTVEPVEFTLAAASHEADVKVFGELDLDLPEGATIHADKGYIDYQYEALLEGVGVKLLSQRKK
ncbi:MAG: hypothetical protein H0V83_05120 [Rubrobacter sp.]|nr:hypothetical protein [Rubrobacter sp.]